MTGQIKFGVAVAAATSVAAAFVVGVASFFSESASHKDAILAAAQKPKNMRRMAAPKHGRGK
jgi:hypothetical protein